MLPIAWKERLGELNSIRRIECETSTQDLISAEVCGPVEIQLEGFAPVYGEVFFMEVLPQDGQYEPLIGHIVLEQCQAAVDMLGHRLVDVKKTDLKGAAFFRSARSSPAEWVAFRGENQRTLIFFGSRCGEMVRGVCLRLAKGRKG